MKMTNWLERAACRGLDPELFFPVDDRPGSDGAERARDVCVTCPVRADCLAFALEEGLDDGVFGGLVPSERRALRRSDASVRVTNVVA